MSEIIDIVLGLILLINLITLIAVLRTSSEATALAKRVKVKKLHLEEKIIDAQLEGLSNGFTIKEEQVEQPKEEINPIGYGASKEVT